MSVFDNVLKKIKLKIGEYYLVTDKGSGFGKFVGKYIGSEIPGYETFVTEIGITDKKPYNAETQNIPLRDTTIITHIPQTDIVKVKSVERKINIKKNPKLHKIFEELPERFKRHVISRYTFKRKSR